MQEHRALNLPHFFCSIVTKGAITATTGPDIACKSYINTAVAPNLQSDSLWCQVGCSGMRGGGGGWGDAGLAN